MNKTVTVTLNGQIYTLEEDAYFELQKYLEKIKEHFSEDADRDEILKDIEASIAEKFATKVSAKKEVVMMKDVEEIVEELGGVEDFAEEIDGDVSSQKDSKKTEDSSEHLRQEDETSKANKRLYRDTDDVVLAGVCSGIAAYFGIDPVFVRLAFALSVFFGGLGVFIYIILWLAVPEAKTGVQKLEMQGAEVTLKKIEEVAKEKSAEIRSKANEEGWAGVFKVPLNFLSEVFRVIVNFFKKLFPVLGAIIGVFIAISMVAAIAGVTVMVVLAMIGKDSGFIESDIPLDALFTNLSYYLASFSIYFLVVIPLFFILLVGMALIKRKKVFSVAASSVLIGAWFLSLIIISAIAVDISPRAERIMDDWENVERLEKQIELVDFDRLYISDNYKAKLVPGSEYKIIARGAEKELDRIDAKVDRGQLHLSARDSGNICIFCVNREVEFEITMPQLTEVLARNSSEADVSGFLPDTIRVELSGASKMSLDTMALRIDAKLSGASWLSVLGSASNADISLSGASKLNIDDLNLKSMNLKLSGASRAELRGYTDKAIIDVSGSSKVLALSMPMRETQVKASGASKVELDVKEKIYIDSSGSSKVMYRGSPQVEKNESDSSAVETIDIDLFDHKDMNIKVIDGEGIFLEMDNPEFN